MKYLILTATLMITFCSWASPLLDEGKAMPEEEIQMGRESHGGDKVGLEFMASARAGIKEFSTKNVPVNIKDIEGMLSNALIASTDTELLIDRNNNIQSSTAVNYFDEHSRPVIRINSKKWNELSNSNKRALAIHELLCLLKVEKTYDYKYSSILSQEILDNQLAVHGFNCSRNTDRLTEKQLGSLLGNYKDQGEVISLKLFFDFRSNNLKYLYEIENKMMGTFTSSSSLLLCTKKDLPNIYLPIAGSMLTFNLEEKTLLTEHNGPGSGLATINFNRIEK